MNGVLRFCRYAYPPNALGYCGPSESSSIAEHLVHGGGDGELARLAQAFDGAWPYLELIATANGVRDPLDERVVEAYWVGNSLLSAVDDRALSRHVDERFRSRMGTRWQALSDAPPVGSRPHHNFHVFVIYPWVGMLRHGSTVEPLRVLDRCRVRWGVLESVRDGRAEVRSRPLRFDGTTLSLGEPVAEEVSTFEPSLAAGDLVSMHWDRLCERITSRDVVAIDRETRRALAAANAVLARPIASLLG